MRFEEEGKLIPSINSWTKTKVPFTMSEEKLECELLFEEMRQVTESSRLNASTFDQKKPLVIKNRI